MANKVNPGLEPPDFLFSHHPMSPSYEEQDEDEDFEDDFDEDDLPDGYDDLEDFIKFDRS